MNQLNELLPEKVTEYRVVKSGKLDLTSKSNKNIPELSMDGKSYILTSSLKHVIQ